MKGSSLERNALRLLLSHSFDAMLLVDRLGRISDANESASRLFARPLAALIGKRLREVGIERSAGARAASFKLTIRRPDLSVREVLARRFAALTPLTHGWILRESIADRGSAETVASSSRLLMEAERVGGVGGWELELKTGLIAWTPEMRRIMGMSADTLKVTHEDSYSFYAEASRSIVREAFDATITKGAPYDLVLECITAKGARIWVREVCRATRRRGRLVSVIGFTQDITEQRRLAGLLNDIGNQERARIGADLHDGLGQELTGLALLLRGVAGRAEREGSALAAELRGLSKMASKSIETVREIAYGLLPLTLSHVGFRQVLRRLARSTRLTFGVEVSMRFHGDDAHMPVGEIAENLYRIAQEAIANAVKHGHAKRVTLQVRASAMRLVFTVSDNGSGIDLDSHSEGMGLQIMRYRTRMLGGLLDVDRIGRGGTRLRCVMPRNSLSS